MSSRAAALEKLLASGKDDALLRFSLGNAWLNDDPTLAATHFRAALAFDPHYSAAWKLLGKALVASNDTAGAIDAYRQGITVAGRKGDLQAAKEMQVFLNRLQRQA